jgi:hypothetical protein
LWLFDRRGLKRLVLIQFIDVTFYPIRFATQKILDGARKSRIFYQVRGSALHWHKPPGKFVFALGSAFKKRKPIVDAVFDRLVITRLKVQS